MREFDKREDEQDVSQAAKKKLIRTAYMVLNYFIPHKHYERLVYLSMKGLKLGKILENIFFFVVEET